MDWFSDGSLRAQWRFAQFVLGIPLFLFAVQGLVMVGLLFVDPSGSLARLRGIGLGFWLTLGLSLWAISGIERHLRVSPRPQSV